MLNRSTYISRELTEVIEKCTEYHCDKRYRTAEALMQALNSVNQEHEQNYKSHRSIGSTQLHFLVLRQVVE